MRFVLSRAVFLCQRRRLLALAALAPVPAAIVVAFVMLAPLALARVGAALGDELAPALGTSAVATALVLGPCLAAAAAGAGIALSLPTREGLGQQIAASPCGDRSAIGAPLLLPGMLAGVVMLPSLAAFITSLANSFPGGRAAGLALGLAILAAVPAGALAAEAAQIAVRGRRSRLSFFVLGLGAWMIMGKAMGAAPLGPLAAVAGAVQGRGSAWVALVVAALVALGLGGTWIELAARRPEQRPRVARRRPLVATGRFPVLGATAALVWRRMDVRRASLGALSFGLLGAMIGVAAGAASPGPFLLSTTTTLAGSLVAPLATFSILSSGSWIWLGAPRGVGWVTARASFVGLVAAALPVGVVASAAAVASGVDWQTAGAVSVLLVMGGGVATVAGSLVPWQGEGIGDQVSAVAALIAAALATSLAIGLFAPRLAAAGLPDPVIAAALCGLVCLLAIATPAWRLESVAR